MLILGFPVANEILKVHQFALEVTQTLLVTANPPVPLATSNAVLDPKFRAQVIALPSVAASAGLGKLSLNIQLPDGYAMNDQAPFTLHVYSDQVMSVADADNNLKLTLPKMPVTLPIVLVTGQTSLTLDSRVYYCEVIDESRCIPAQYRFVVPLTVDSGAGHADISLSYQVHVPKD
jgi:hypothetical protein